MAAQFKPDPEALDRADTVLSCLNAVSDLAQALDDVRGRGKPSLHVAR